MMGLMDNAGPERDTNSPFQGVFIYFQSGRISMLFFYLLATILVYHDLGMILI